MSARNGKRRASQGRGAARLLPGWIAALVCTLAVLAACLTPSASAQTRKPPEAKPAADAGADAAAPADKEEEEEEAPSAPTQPTAQELAGGRHMLPKDAEVPVEWMPPGSAASPLPSEEIFPPQSLTIRFNHKLHVKDQQQTCKTCHAAAYKSNAASERLLPKPSDTCDSCHDVDHSDLSNVKAGTDANGQCNFCHLGEGAGKGNKVAPLVIPTPQLHFPHGKHLARNIQCGNCHGKVDELELATRDNLPRMAGCFDCHNKSSAAQAKPRAPARSAM
ncbi:MAG: cytochrome c3 family protein [Polyangiaceae bacterium]